MSRLALDDKVAKPRRRSVGEFRALLNSRAIRILDGDSDMPPWDSMFSVAMTCHRLNYFHDTGIVFEEFAEAAYLTDIGYHHRVNESGHRSQAAQRSRFMEWAQKAWDKSYNEFDPNYELPKPDLEITASLVAMLPLAKNWEAPSCAKAALGALIQHAINVGQHPVTASSVELAAVAGKSRQWVARGMNYLESTHGPGRPVLKVSRQKSYSKKLGYNPKARLWTLDLQWLGTAREQGAAPLGGIHTTTNVLPSRPATIRQKLESLHETLRLSDRYTTKELAVLVGADSKAVGRALSKLAETGGTFGKLPAKQRYQETVWIVELPYEERQRQTWEKTKARMRQAGRHYDEATGYWLPDDPPEEHGAA
jgi:hypothetical protein